MLILLMILIIVSVIVINKAYNDDNTIVEISFYGIVSVSIIALFTISIYVLLTFTEGFTANDKINMYQEENKKIEKDVNVLVEKYTNYESNTFSDLKTTSPTTLVSLFPELKSNELVKKQIEIYVANNNKIKELKEIKIDMKLARWLLYFGK